MNLKSRKLIVFVVSLAAFVTNSLLGSPIAEESLQEILALIIGWLVAQGIADHGSQGAANAARLASSKTVEAIEDIKDVVEDGAKVLTEGE